MCRSILSVQLPPLFRRTAYSLFGRLRCVASGLSGVETERAWKKASRSAMSYRTREPILE